MMSMMAFLLITCLLVDKPGFESVPSWVSKTSASYWPTKLDKQDMNVGNNDDDADDNDSNEWLTILSCLLGGRTGLGSLTGRGFRVVDVVEIPVLGNVVVVVVVVDVKLLTISSSSSPLTAFLSSTSSFFLITFLSSSSPSFWITCVLFSCSCGSVPTVGEFLAESWECSGGSAPNRDKLGPPDCNPPTAAFPSSVIGIWGWYVMWEYENMIIWEYENMRIWKYDNMRLCKYENMRTCKYENMKIWGYKDIAW